MNNVGRNEKITPLLPLESATAVASSDLETTIPFAFGGKEAMATAVDTLRLRLISLLGVISSSSWDFPPCPCPSPRTPAMVLKNMSKMTERGYRYPAVTTVAVKGGTRSGM